jgi:ribosome recycling factor
VINDTLNEADDKMNKSVDATREDFATLRAGRVTPTVFNKLTVEYYGTPTPIQQLATFTSPEPRVIVIAPFDASAMPNIEKAIRDSDLGVNPSNDGRVLRAVFPELTEERRKDYIKLARHKAEDARVSVRNIRRRAKEELDRIARDGEAGEDEVTRAEKELEHVTKRHVDAIDDLLKHKETELLEV